MLAFEAQELELQTFMALVRVKSNIRLQTHCTSPVATESRVEDELLSIDIIAYGKLVMD